MLHYRIDPSKTTVASTAKIMSRSQPAEVKVSDPFLQLIQTLQSDITEDALLVSIGCGSFGTRRTNVDEQQLPTYIKNMAKAGKKVRVLLIDEMLEDRWSKSVHFPDRDGLTDIEYFEKHQPVTRIDTDYHSKYTYQLNGGAAIIQIFPCNAPYFETMNFYQILQRAIETCLSKGAKVFIGNHANCWSLEHYPPLGDIYNSVKKSHPNAKSLQLYTGTGASKVRYYLDKLYDEKSYMKKSAALFVSESFFEKNYGPVGDEFNILSDLASLASLPEFKFAEVECLLKAAVETPAKIAPKDEKQSQEDFVTEAKSTISGNLV